MAIESELRSTAYACTSLCIPELLTAILKLFPLDTCDENPVQTLSIDRFDFYDRAKKSFAIVHTGETAQYGNIILKKGLVLS
ncbi:fucose mutarotase-like [Tubulanus polymorphus]|uniref:fucose mutarotase-like n=1 Tax=Tubulanus polymorphus TaxID=672921 RepID=UPI003DA5BC69